MDLMMKNTEELGKMQQDKDSRLQEKEKELIHAQEQIAKVMQEKTEKVNEMDVLRDQIVKCRMKNADQAIRLEQIGQEQEALAQQKDVLEVQNNQLRTRTLPEFVKTTYLALVISFIFFSIPIIPIPDILETIPGK